MDIKRTTTCPTTRQIKHACTAIRSDWSERERRKRRKAGEAKQRWLAALLSSVSDRSPARVA